MLNQIRLNLGIPFDSFLSHLALVAAEPTGSYPGWASHGPHAFYLDVTLLRRDEFHPLTAGKNRDGTW